MVGRPKGLPNKVNRPARALLEAAQEELAKRLLGLAQPTRPSAEACPTCSRGGHDSCVLCGCGTARPEELQLRAIAEGLDRGGTPKTTHVEVTEKPDTEWLEYATHDEAEQVLAIVERCRGRMPINDERVEETVN